MKQLLLRKGKIKVEDVPAPARISTNLLVEVTHSLISTGTEMASVQLSKASLIKKAKARPKEVSKVLNSIKVRGLKKTFELVQQKLDESKPLGYSCAGRVLAVGQNTQGFQVGDRVACAGATLANHAEVVSVPQNLVVKVPQKVANSDAAFVTIGAIAMQGVRRADVRLGESICVIGLGLIGQITVQLLKAAGCRVYGIDTDGSRVEKAIQQGLDFGTTNPDELNQTILNQTESQGVDATLLTASTPSSDPTRQAFELTRKKGKIVVVGAVGMDLERSPFYEKEQDFLISCSYGPGRYDPIYELQGQDYPYAYVRWTENRNMSSFLQLINDKKIDVSSLVTNTYPIKEASSAFQELEQKNGQKPLAVVLSYPENKNGYLSNKITKGEQKTISTKGKIRIGLIGAGNFMKTVHIPNLQKLKSLAQINAVCTQTSASAETMGRQLKAELITTDAQEILTNKDIDAVIIATRHDRHAEMVKAAIQNNKHVFVEKPLALTFEELEELQETVLSASSMPVLMVGFNRRFSPFIVELKKALANRKSPLMAVFRVNAGALAKNHWAQTKEGGGRLRGEACHMIDTFQHLVGSSLKNVSIQGVQPENSGSLKPDENFSSNFTYEDGSVCTLIYTSVGNIDLGKESVEVHWDGNSAVINDFKTMEIKGTKSKKLKSTQNKGHAEIMKTFLDSIRLGKSFPIAWSDLFETTQATVELDQEVWGKISS